MNFLKRGILSCVFNTKRTVMYFLIFLLLALLFQVCLTAYMGTVKQDEQYRQEVDTKIIIEGNNMRHFDLINLESNGIDSALVTEIETISGVTDNIKLALSQADFDGEVYKSELQIEEFPEDSRVYIRGLSKAEAIDSGIIILDGQGLESDSQMSTMVSKAFADLNGLKVGNKINLKSEFVDSEVEAEIIGIFDFTQAPVPVAEPEKNAENLLYTSLDVAYALNGVESILEMQFSVENGEIAGKIRTDIENILDEEQAKFVDILIDDTQYISLQENTAGVKGAVLAITVTIFAMTIVVVCMLTVLHSQRKSREFGVLMSMGENPIKIAMQVTIEMALPLLLAITVCMPTVPIVAGGLTNALGTGEISWDLQTVSLVYISALSLVVISSLLILYKVLKYKPRQILADGE